jgi:hypothetical protein
MITLPLGSNEVIFYRNMHGAHSGLRITIGKKSKNIFGDFYWKFLEKKKFLEKFLRKKIEIQIRLFLYFWYFDC